MDLVGQTGNDVSRKTMAFKKKESERTTILPDEGRRSTKKVRGGNMATQQANSLRCRPSWPSTRKTASDEFGTPILLVVDSILGARQGMP